MELKPATTMSVTVTCRLCKKSYVINNVSIQGFIDWENGRLIQNVLPELNAEQRELLISQTCGACWNKMFSGQQG